MPVSDIVTKEAEKKGTRLASYMAKCGVASRRKSEEIINQRRVKVDGEVIDTPVFFVLNNNNVTVDGKDISLPEEVKLWLYHKPTDLVTTHNDPQGRPTVFEDLKDKIGDGHLISVGRLDVNSEGLLLITNSGDLSRKLERPVHGFERVYQVCVFGDIYEIINYFKNETEVEIDDVIYTAKAITHVCQKKCRRLANHWIEFTLTEGKNREIRRICNAFDLQVKKLIRTAYGPFQLRNLEKGRVKEVRDLSSIM